MITKMVKFTMFLSNSFQPLGSIRAITIILRQKRRKFSQVPREIIGYHRRRAFAPKAEMTASSDRTGSNGRSRTLSPEMVQTSPKANQGLSRSKLESKLIMPWKPAK